MDKVLGTVLVKWKANKLANAGYKCCGRRWNAKFCFFFIIIWWKKDIYSRNLRSNQVNCYFILYDSSSFIISSIEGIESIEFIYSIN